VLQGATERAVPIIAGYEVLGELGRGGMGVVYRARQVLLNRPCVLKMILAGTHAGAEAVVRFLAEAEAVARLQHPNVVEIHHIGVADGLPFFELEYVEGGSLDRRLDGTPWPVRRAGELVEALAQGVAQAHDHGLIHRDLKPGNVLLTADGAPKIADFGLAKALDRESGLTRSDSIVGSPSYMAPEQAAGQAKLVGPLADVYALGAILYELLAGRPPFRGTTVMETLEQVKAAEPVPPRRLVPGLPRDVETIALKCLQKEPLKRYDSAAALAADLRRFLANEPIIARPVPFWERGWRWCRRHPAPATLTAALVLVAALGLTAILWQWSEAVKARDLATRRAAAEAGARLEAESSLALARKAVDASFTKVSESKLMNMPGMRPLRRDLLESALAFYEEFVRRGGEEPSLLAELAATQARIGLIYTDLSEPDKARASLNRAAELYEKTLAVQPHHVGLLKRLSDVCNALAVVEAQRDAQTAIAALEKAVAIGERLVAEQPGEPRFRMALSSSLNGIALLTTGDAQLDAFRRSLELRLKLAAEIADDPDVLHGLSALFNNLNGYLSANGHRDEALELLKRSIEYGRAALVHRPHDFEFTTDLADSYRGAAGTCWALGRRDEALAISVERVTFLRKLTADNPEVPAFRASLLHALAEHGSWLVDLKRGLHAVSWLREAAEVVETNPHPDATTLATGATYRARAAILLAGDLAGGPLELWPVAARREVDVAVADLKRAVDRGYRGWDTIRESQDFKPLLARADVKGLLREVDRTSAKVSPAVAMPEEAPTRLASPLDQPGRLEEDRILGDVAVALLQGKKGEPEQFSARLGAILAQIDAQRRSGRDSPALERSAESIGVMMCEQLLKAGKLADAQRRLSQLSDLKVGGHQALLNRGSLFAQVGLLDRAAPYFARAIALAPHDRSVYRMVAAAHARLARWDLAAEKIAKLVERNPDDHWNWYLSAVIAARSGNPEPYRRFCRTMLDRFHDTNDPEIAERTAKSSLLLPVSELKQEAGQMAERAVARATGGVVPWALAAKGLAEYRAQRFTDALATIQKSQAAMSGSGPWYFEVPARCVHAMALSRLGRRDEARAALERASELYRSNAPQNIALDPGPHWNDHLICEVLHREAEAVILYDPIFPADPFAQ
jgi:tetratricopeptide (TPR) repeat protein